MNLWSSKKLDDVAEFTNGGAWNQTEYVDSGIPVVRVSDISDRTINLDSCKYLPLDSLNKYRKHLLFEGDLIIATVGSHPTQPASVVGKAAIIPKNAKGALLNQNAVRIRPKSDLLDKGYLRYFGQSKFFRDYIISHARGSANQVRISIGALKDMDVTLPSLPTQRKIASILSAYDDLIENNTRRIKILEEMAQALYREWFVHFRFPGHEKVQMWDSPLGRIPVGWEVKDRNELLCYHIGGGWGEEKQIGEFVLPAYVIRGTDIPEARMAYIDNCPLRFHKNSTFKNRVLKEKDIIFEVSGGSKNQPVGRALFVNHRLLEAFHRSVICASFCKLFRNNDSMIPEIFYLYLFHIYENGEINKYQVQSTGITNFKFSNFLQDKIIVPNRKLQSDFYEIINPILEQMYMLGIKTSNLRRTRDLLLPKLISGELDIENLDINIGNLNT
jgi:type I restriction enzyme, S subunit